MGRNFKAWVAGLGLLALASVPAAAQSGCTGQAAAGRFCGNAAATTGLPGLVTGPSLFDRAFGSTQGRILNRGGVGWVSTESPTLGVNGGLPGQIVLMGATSGSVTLGPRATGSNTTFNFPNSNGTNGFVLVTDGGGNTSWQSNTAGGTVQSVGLSLPASVFTVSGSPVTLTGTLTGSLATQTANLVWAGPTSGGAATPTFRALVGADLPNPSASTLGGIRSFAAVSSQWINQISTSGIPTAAQPNFTDIAGTLAAAQCPNPGASSLGCVQSLAAVTSRWINQISTSGVPTASQPAFTDISGSASLSQLPSISNQSVLGNNSGGTAVPSALSASQVLDFIGSTRGQVLYRGASNWTVLAVGTSGQVLTTGGAGADPAWATVTGTGTVTNVATGTGLTGGPITTTGTIQLATIANNTVLANVSGGVLAPSSTTPTLILDIIGATQGNILYRAAGNWTVLAPGTNGQVLTMGATTPAWGSAGTVSNVTIAAGTGISVSGTCNISTTGTCTIANTGVRSVTLGGGYGIAVTGTNPVTTTGTFTAAVQLSLNATALGSNVALNNTGLYFDGPSVAQGSTGTWWATGTVTVQDTAGAANIDCKLWDGTTVISSSRASISAANLVVSISLSGALATPAGNLRISCKDNASTSGVILFNATGNNLDSKISVFRMQ